MESNKKKEAMKPVKTFRNRGIGASVWQQSSQDGFEYLDFTISRSWKAKSGKEGYSNRYFSVNRAELHKTIDEVCDYLDAQASAQSQA